MAAPRVLLAPIEIAGQLALTAAGLRAAGVEATAFAPPHHFGYDPAPDVSPVAGKGPALRQLTGLLRKHDVVHFHFAQSFAPPSLRNLDARVVKLVKSGRVLVTFWGSDIRRPSVERARNPHYVPFEGDSDTRAEERLRRWSSIAGGHVVVPEPSLVDHIEPFFDHLHPSRLMVDARQFAPRPPDPRVVRPRILHSPTARAGKGTVHVRAAVAELERRGLAFEYREIHGMSQDEARAEYERADLVVDQLCVGSHGVFAIEAMSMAKPVLCHMAPSRHRFPADLPIIQADPDTVADVLAEWLQRPEDRREVGLAGRDYAERVHDVRVVGVELAELYARLFG